MVNLKTSDLNNESCACCREHFCNFVTRCNHFFHHACLLKNMAHRKKCPKCFTSITSNTLYERFLAGYEIQKKGIYHENFENLVDFVHLIADSKVKVDENVYNMTFTYSYNLNHHLTQRGRDGINLLYKAAKTGHLFIAKLVLNYFNDNFDDGKYYPLFGACVGNNPEIVDLLLEHGAKIDTVNPETGYTFAHYIAMSGNSDLIDKALELNVDFLVKNNENISPLHLACQGGHFKAAKKLIELGSDVKALSIDGYSMLHAACVGGNFELFKFMIDLGLDIHATYRNGISSVHGAVQGGNVDILNYLMEQKVDYSIALFNPLHVAAKLNNLEMIKKLLEFGFDINSVDCDGNTPLHYACTFEFDKVVIYLLDHEAKIDLLNAKGESAIHQAFELENFDIILHPKLRNQTLIWALKNKNRTAIGKLDELGDKRAPILFEFPNEYFELLERLLSNPDADLNTTILDDEGNNLFLLACKHNLRWAVIAAFDNELDVDVSNYNGDSTLHFSCLNGDYESILEILSLPNTEHMITALNKKGQNSLHCAFLNDNNPPKVIYNLARNDTVNVPDNDGNTPVHLAFATGYFKCFDDSEKLDIDYNVRNNDGKTPLHLAAENGHLEAVKFLIEKGVYAKVLDANNNLAIDLAKMNNHKEVAEFLTTLN